MDKDVGYPDWWLEDDDVGDEEWEQADLDKWTDADIALDEWKDRQLEEE